MVQKCYVLDDRTACIQPESGFVALSSLLFRMPGLLAKRLLAQRLLVRLLAKRLQGLMSEMLLTRP